MNTHVALPPGKLTAEEFEEFTKHRPREERWQLVDGEAFMMSPANVRHQLIGRNLARLLDRPFEKHRPELVAVQEVALRLDGSDHFRPVADVVVIDADVYDEVYGTRFYLVAEVLSPSNTMEHISRKRALYAQAPDCLYILIIAQDDFAIEVWSRADGWKGLILRSPDDLIELPDFSFTCRVADLYHGVRFK